jgi:hypothetical protein
MGVVGIQLRRYLLRLSGCERNPGGGIDISTPTPTRATLRFAKGPQFLFGIETITEA